MEHLFIGQAAAVVEFKALGLQAAEELAAGVVERHIKALVELVVDLP